MNNARLHPDSQIKQLAGSIREFDFNQPILIDPKDTVIAGHARLMAAKLAGLSEVPTIQITHLDATRQKAYILADNRIAMDAEWDNDLLKIETMTLRNEGFDLALAGFNDDDLKRLDAKVIEPSEGLTDPDAMPESKAEPISKEGDVWVLGNHRLMCGDSTLFDSVDKLMSGEKAHMIFTDPPYGVDFVQGKFKGTHVNNRDFDPIKNDHMKGDQLKDFIQQALTNAAMFSDVCSIYVWAPPMLEGMAIFQATTDAGWHIQSQIIWNKSSLVLGRADYHWKHEICWYGYKGRNHQWHGGRDKTTIWDVAKTKNSDLHPTMKPVELAIMACENSTMNGNNVVDLFGGAGSTLIACEKTGRKCLMMEIDPVYCDTIIRRWQEFSGKEAILESNGRTFKECNNV